MYGKIKSEFIKKKIRGREWKDSDYIDDLIKIEHYVLHGTLGGWTTGYMIKSLKEDHPKEFNAIYNELKPKEFKAIQKHEKKEKEKEKKQEEKNLEQEKAELKKLKQEWVKAGGKA